VPATKARPLPEVVEELMRSRGIEDLEELHARFVETEYAYIPVPGRHRGKPVSLDEFKRHGRGEYPILYGEFAQGVAKVLELTNEEMGELAYSYMWGRPRFMQ
jgi:hypothetical protein